MSNLTIEKLYFAAYQFDTGEWVKWSWDGADVYGEIRGRTKDSFTVDGNKVTGEDGENVYKMEEYDSDSGEFTGQMVAKAESSVSSWAGPQNSSDIEGAALSMTFEMDKSRIFEAWDSLVNMSEEEMEMWEKHPCSDVGVDNGSDWRDNTMMLMGQAPDGWNEESYRIANRIVSWARKHIDDLPDNAPSGGEGTCPAPLAVKMLNRGINPFDESPSGNPTFSESVDTVEFASDSQELDEVYSKWSEKVNMTASKLERWSEHPCADTASKDPEAVRKRNMRLLEKNKSDWTQRDIDDAKRTVSFISRMKGQRPDSPSEGGKGTCPSEWAVSLLNWAYNPFDSLPEGDPKPEQENSASLDDSKIAFAASAISPKRKEIVQDFNEHGIRENYDDNGNLVSVDAVFEAMEPGPPEDRNGVRITKDFLQNVAEKDYSNNPPYIMDHTKQTLSQIGFVKDVWFNDSTNKLMLMARAYNTGSQTHNEIISRLTFDPPTLTDGSVGFGNQYESEVNDDGETELVDGKLREFSTTPFPAGYDEGGLKTDYSEDESSEVGVFVVAS